MKYTSLTLGIIEAVFNKLGGLEGAARLLRGELVLVEAPQKDFEAEEYEEEKSLEAPLDFVVRLPRLAGPIYPTWVRRGGEVLHADLELMGPLEYDLQKDVEFWFHKDQKIGKGVLGQVIYDFLLMRGELRGHLGLADLLAIQAMGIEVFRRLYGGSTVYGWRSVVRSRHKNFRVPFVYEYRGRVLLGWATLDSSLNGNNPALRFKKK